MTGPIYFVVPACNEARQIASVVRQVRARFEHVVVIDDGSRDDTAQRASDAGATVLRHVINRGQGAALRTGIEFALGQGAVIIVTFDSDGQHRLEDAECAIAIVARGECDVALGSRFLRDGGDVPWLRRLTLKGGVLFTRLVSGIVVTDTHNGLRALSRRAAEQIRMRQDRMAHASELLDEIARAKLSYREIPTKISYSSYSKDKGQSSAAAFRIAFEFLLGKSRR